MGIFVDLKFILGSLDSGNWVFHVKDKKGHRNSRERIDSIECKEIIFGHFFGGNLMNS